ncbi:RNA cap guanine-N2 methyltransferase [Diaporthe amygdali]|uniref:RNA cap guanine-N2 methyltransferase n=1 Tax=Phomopsis amygdali TaxID=1214568 RepID=UPI0022FEFE72|nr:RNA cap guanine-N2 methyltransferase [Diaporthe amygdali]KAJ0121284.1 RNA cap guanine-N2 methyltransferase [Diaporthe amygdali]
MKKGQATRDLPVGSSGSPTRLEKNLNGNQYLSSKYGSPAGIMKPADRLRLTKECKHYSSYDEMPENLKKYWYQRNTLWQYDDYDIRMTDAAWFGVTPEPIAVEIANELAAKHDQRGHRPSVIIDLFAGAGGNTIQFALSGHWDRVIAVEYDAATLACAQHNAEVYEVSDYITFVHADCFDYLNRLVNRPDTLDDALNVRPGQGEGGVALARGVELFASPPWGGVGYEQTDVFDLEVMEPYSLTHISAACRPMAHALFLPRNGDLRQLASLIPDGSAEKLDVVQYCVKGASKGLVAYYPPENEHQAHEMSG